MEGRRFLKSAVNSPKGQPLGWEHSSLNLPRVVVDFDKYSSNEFEDISKPELEMYLEEKKLLHVEVIDVLGYWKTNESRYPMLSKVARDVLTISLSTITSESAFSIGGKILNAFRSSLKPDVLEAVICLRDWLFDKALVPVEVNLDEVCGDVTGMNINEDSNDSTEGPSSEGAGSGYGKNSALSIS